MTIFENSNDLQIEEASQPKRRNPVKLLVVPVVLGSIFFPLAANGQFSGQNLGRIFDAAQGIWGQIRRQQSGGAQPTQAQVDAQAREQARLDAARRAVGETRTFYRNASTRNYGGIFDQVTSLLGEFGFLDPAAVRQAGGMPGNPANPGGAMPAGLTISGNPTTVSETVALFNYAALRPSLVTQTSLQGIFGPEGQNLLARQREEMAALTGGSQELAALTAEDAKVNAQIANENAGLIARIESLGNSSRARTASQDVLKDLAQQQGFAGNLLGGLSLQQERLGNMQASLSGQLSILQAQGDMQSFQATQQLMVQAGMSSQLVQVEGEIRDARNYAINQNMAMYRGASMNQTVFIYGLNSDPNYGLPVPTGSTLASRP